MAMYRTANIPEERVAEGRISSFLRTTLQPIPLLTGLTALGFIAIYVMGRVGILDALGWQLLVAAAILLVVAVAHVGAMNLARGGRGIASYIVYAVTMTAAGFSLALFWQGVPALALLMVWLAPGTSFNAGIPRRYYWSSVVLSAIATFGILWFEARPILPRLVTTSTSGIAALLLLTSMLILFALVTVTTQLIRYRTLQGRLVGSLIPIIAVPILFTASVAAFNSLTSSQAQARGTLEAASSLKSTQVGNLVGSIFTDMGPLQQGSRSAGSILSVLVRGNQSDETYRLNASIAATFLRNFIVQHPAINYQQVLLLDAAGKVVLSTYPQDLGTDFSAQQFFKDGLTRTSAEYYQFPGQQNIGNEYLLVAAAPFFGASEQDIRGVVVTVTRGDAVQTILAPSAGMTTESTYLVDRLFRPVTQTGPAESTVNSAAIRQVIQAQAGSGSGLYLNYAGVPVFGYYAWDPDIQAALVTEIPQAALIGSALGGLLGTALVGLLTIFIAVIAVTSTARSISEPVGNLAGVAGQLATGQLTTRAPTDRRDEIGQLANAFNSMANQLQTIIADLERRVADRTRDLQQQAARLRTAAEVARDATLAPTLDELLNRASTRVLEQFRPEHVGLFLLDDTRQYAVLQAAPTDIGRRMLKDGYRVPLGAAGVVSQVAVTGEPTFVYGSDVAAAGAGDAYHPNTQAELALPLRTNEGVIGVLDMQSSQADAFVAGDVAIMQVLADQLAAAIERGRLLLQVQQRLGQLEQTYRTFTEQAWSAFTARGGAVVGYRYDNVRLDPLNAIPEAARAALRGDIAAVTSSGNGSDGGKAAVIPIKLRGQTLGVINVNFRSSHAPQQTVAMVQQAADRLATALENVRLLEDSQRRANKERLIGEITSKISSSINMRNVLQTAVEELGRVLPGSDVSIKLRTAPPEPQKDMPS